jgi:hypothetical protein
VSLPGSVSTSSTPANQVGPHGVDAAGSPRRSRRRSCQGDQEELSRLPSDVSAMLKETGIAETVAHKQKHGRSAKVGTDYGSISPCSLAWQWALHDALMAACLTPPAATSWERVTSVARHQQRLLEELLNCSPRWDKLRGCPPCRSCPPT